MGDKKVKLSTLQMGTYVDCNGEVTTVEGAIKRVKNGESIEVYLISDEYISSILKQAHDNHKKGIMSAKLSAPNKGAKVVVDIV